MTENNSYKNNLLKNFGPVFKELGGLFSKENIKSLTDKPLSTSSLLAGTALATTAYIGIEYGALSALSSSLAFVGMAMSYKGATQELHSNILSWSSVAVGLFQVAQIIDMTLSQNWGAYIPGIIMLGHAQLTMGTFLAAPNASAAFKKAVVFGGGLVGGAAVLASSKAFGVEHGLMLAATVPLNGYLFSLSDGNTPRARMGYLFANAAHMAYYAPLGMVALIATDGLYMYGHLKSKLKYDVPITESPDTDQRLSIKQSLSRYFKQVIWGGKPAVEVGKTRDNLKLESPLPNVTELPQAIGRGTKSLVLGR